MTVRAHVALRAKLAAWLVLAMLVTGIFNARPVLPEAARPAGQTQSLAAAAMQALGPRTILTRARSGSQVGQASRPRHAHRRSPRLEEIHQAAAVIAWPDLEKGAPSAPRFVYRKMPSADGADAEADPSHAPVKGNQSRAPPAMA